MKGKTVLAFLSAPSAGPTYLYDTVLLHGQPLSLPLKLGRCDQPLDFGSLGVGLSLSVCVLPGIDGHVAASRSKEVRAERLSWLAAVSVIRNISLVDATEAPLPALHFLLCAAC